MVNSWSLLYDAMNDDDMLSFNVEGVDLSSEVYPPVTGNVDITVNSERFKYNEDAILKELKEYISATYNQHYSSEGIQTLDSVSYTHLTLPTICSV